MRLHKMGVMGVLQVPPAAGGITWVGGTANTTGGSTATSLAGSLPTHAADDFAIAYCRGDGNTTVFSLTGVSGWTQLEQHAENITGTNSKEAIFYKKLTSSSETAPTLASTESTEISIVIMVFRGVDTTTPFDVTYDRGLHYAAYENQWNVSNPSITTANANSCVVLLQGLTTNDLDTVGAPSGYTAGPFVTTGNHNEVATAYLLDAGAAGVKSPGAWSHTESEGQADSRCFTLALRAA